MTFEHLREHREIAKILSELPRDDEEAREDAIYELPLVGDRAHVLAALLLFSDREELCRVTAGDGLIDHPAASIPILIEIVDTYPLSDATGMAAYVLGEIGFKQGAARETRLVEAALRYLERTRDAGIEHLGDAISFTRELVRAGPIPEASPYARLYLEAIEHVGDDVLLDANDAFAILYANEKMAFIERARREAPYARPGAPTSRVRSVVHRADGRASGAELMVSYPSTASRSRFSRARANP